MAVLKCKMCGGDLNIVEGETVAVCEYCDTKQTVPTVDNEKKMTLFARANRLRAACEFDKASGIYENIVSEFPEEAEAYWGLLLCKYGIEYVDDPATGRKIPTCHRSSFDSIMDDGNFDQVMENSDPVARKVYREEAKTIEDIRKGILEVSSKEEPYDIFICYKETDENGERTIDSVLAQDIYDMLTENGYRVFFSRITLEDKLGTAYEPYIFAALNSAKIMLAVGTDYDYYNAVWVKNEWSRFLSLIAKGEKKTLIPCYKNIDAYDIPKEFKHLQAQDMGKVGAIQDLLRGIKKIIGANDSAKTVIKETVEVKTSDSVAPLLRRASMFLEDGDWERANEYCEKVLDLDPENAQAYLIAAMSEYKCKERSELKNRYLSRCNKNIIRSKKYAVDELNAFFNEWDSELEDDRNYDKACDIMKEADSESKYQNAARAFAKLAGYRDSDIRQNMCLRLAEECTAKKLKQDNESTQIKILRLLENNDGQFSARELRDLLQKQKRKPKNVQTNCEILIQQGKLEEHKEKGRTTYSLIGREQRLKERQLRLEQEAKAEQERKKEQEKQVQQLKAERTHLKQELESLSAFRFKRKKEIQERLENIAHQLHDK